MIRSRFLVLLPLLGLAACDGNGAAVATPRDATVDAEDHVAAFVGQWQWTSGTTMITCAGTPLTPSQLTGTFNVSRGTDAPLVVSMMPGCDLRFVNADTAATARPGQTCAVTVAEGFPATLRYSSGTMILSGQASTISATGDFAINANGQTVTCTFTQSGTAMKLG